MSTQVEIRLDVPYGGGPDGKLCNDVYLPAGPGPHAALLCFHGGAWAHGSRRQYQEWGPWLAARGYALVAVEYRLSKNVSPSWPGVHEDIRRALCWLLEEAPGFRVDPMRLGLVGDSAGGHMAALLSLDDWVRPHLRAVVGVYGIYDLLDWWKVTQKRKDDPVGRPPPAHHGRHTGFSDTGRRGAAGGIRRRRWADTALDARGCNRNRDTGP